MRSKLIKALIASILVSSMLVSCGDTDTSNDSSADNSLNSTIAIDNTPDESAEESSEETTTTAATTTAAKETTTTETTTTEPEPESEPEEPAYSKVKEPVIIEGVRLEHNPISADEITKNGWTEQKEEEYMDSKYYKDGSSNYLTFGNGISYEDGKTEYGMVVMHINDVSNMFELTLPGGVSVNSSYDDIVAKLGTPMYGGDHTENEELVSYKWNDSDFEGVYYGEGAYGAYIKVGRPNLVYYFDFEEEGLPSQISFIMSEDKSRIETIGVVMASFNMK